MARLAIGLLSLALLAVEIAAQSGFDDTRVDDVDYPFFSGSEPPPSSEPLWIQPFVPADPDWRDDLCERYRIGAILCITLNTTYIVSNVSSEESLHADRA